MVDMVFDTLSFARRMEQAGFTRTQAEALAEEQARLIDERLATKTDIATVNGNIEALRLATKSDIATVNASIEALKLATKTDIEALRLATKADIATVNAGVEALRLATKADIFTVNASVEALWLTSKSDLELLRRDPIIKVGGMFVAAVAVISTLVTLLARFPLRP